MEVYTESGQKLILTEPALKVGGEGAIYEIDGYGQRLAKIYTDKNDAKSREEKVKAMVEMWYQFPYMRNLLRDDVAWPIGTLYDRQKNFIGFGMICIDAMGELNDFYIYPSKKNQNISMRDKLKSLISLCDLTGRLHSMGQVVGDFNPENLRIRKDFSVAFVDADSFHVNCRGRIYRCVACTEGRVAPELIRACAGTTYAACKGQTFTLETDHFGLAVSIFCTLMHGVHPYKCQRKQKAAVSMPAPVAVDQRVEKGETPFFRSIPDFEPPHFAPELRLFPPYLVELFRRAFVEGHTNPKARPTAAEWKQGLERYQSELTDCRNPAHSYWNQSRSCPYCAADERHRNRWRILQRGQTPAPQPVHQPVPVPAPQPTPPPAPVPQPAPQNPTTPPQNPTPAPVVPTTPPAKGLAAAEAVYWVVTLMLSAAVLLRLAGSLLPAVFVWLGSTQAIFSCGTMGAIIAGIIGVIIFNCVHIEGKNGGTYGISDYLQSVGVGVLTAAAFVLVLLLLVELIQFLAFVMGGLMRLLVGVGILAAFLSR